VEDLHSLENSSTIVGDCDVTLVISDHFIHALWPERGTDGISDGLGGFDVGHSDLERSFKSYYPALTYVSWLLLILEGSFAKLANWRSCWCCCVSGGHL
jgi:hypothetical protein